MSALLSTKCVSLANFLLWKPSTCPKTAGEIEKKNSEGHGEHSPGTRKQTRRDTSLHITTRKTATVWIWKVLHSALHWKPSALPVHGAVWRLWSVGGKAWLMEVVHWGLVSAACPGSSLHSLSFLPELCEHVPTVNDWTALLCLSQ